MKRKHEFHIVIERDEDGMYVAEVIGLKGCYTQARSMDELLKRVREAIELYGEERSADKTEFIGVQRVAV